MLYISIEWGQPSVKKSTCTNINEPWNDSIASMAVFSFFFYCLQSSSSLAVTPPIRLTNQKEKRKKNETNPAVKRKLNGSTQCKRKIYEHCILLKRPTTVFNTILLIADGILVWCTSFGSSARYELCFV